MQGLAIIADYILSIFSDFSFKPLEFRSGLRSTSRAHFAFFHADSTDRARNVVT